MSISAYHYVPAVAGWQFGKVKEVFQWTGSRFDRMKTGWRWNGSACQNVVLHLT